ncbi:unnamed protein product [Amoebophrya sp. A25]|nr:unnamed protein product [Amoebophrya sp. A25]|eukprot:GSA25T00012806001.1
MAVSILMKFCLCSLAASIVLVPSWFVVTPLVTAIHHKTKKNEESANAFLALIAADENTENPPDDPKTVEAPYGLRWNPSAFGEGPPPPGESPPALVLEPPASLKPTRMFANLRHKAGRWLRNSKCSPERQQEAVAAWCPRLNPIEWNGFSPLKNTQAASLAGPPQQRSEECATALIYSAKHETSPTKGKSTIIVPCDTDTSPRGVFFGYENEAAFTETLNQAYKQVKDAGLDLELQPMRPVGSRVKGFGYNLYVRVVVPMLLTKISGRVWWPFYEYVASNFHANLVANGILRHAKFDVVQGTEDAKKRQEECQQRERGWTHALLEAKEKARQARFIWHLRKRNSEAEAPEIIAITLQDKETLSLSCFFFEMNPDQNGGETGYFQWYDDIAADVGKQNGGKDPIIIRQVEVSEL